jgi:hypothetical protein
MNTDLHTFLLLIPYLQFDPQDSEIKDWCGKEFY